VELGKKRDRDEEENGALGLGDCVTGYLDFEKEDRERKVEQDAEEMAPKKKKMMRLVKTGGTTGDGQGVETMPYEQ